MTQSFICRYGNQSIFQLRGVTSLSRDEQAIFAQCLGIWLEREVQPLEGENKTITVADD